MDTALVVITLISIGLTAGLLVYAARLQREQRERSAARVLALRGAIGMPVEPLRRGGAVDPVEPLPPTAPLFRAPAAARDAVVTSASEPRDAGPSHDDPSSTAAPAPLFAEAAADRRGWGRAAGVIVMAGIALLAILFVVGSVERPRAAAPAAAPLQLTALAERLEGSTLVVTGTVDNPSGGAPRQGLTAVVFVFDRAGAFVASGRAPLDVQRLEQADTSPFTVRVPDAAAAARYRVSFRNDAGIVPHVDRRQ